MNTQTGMSAAISRDEFELVRERVAAAEEAFQIEKCGGMANETLSGVRAAALEAFKNTTLKPCEDCFEFYTRPCVKDAVIWFENALERLGSGYLTNECVEAVVDITDALAECEMALGRRLPADSIDAFFHELLSAIERSVRAGAQ